MQPIETALDNLFKKLPQMPESARKGLASFIPWLTLLGGIVSLLAAWYLYQAVAWVDQWATGMYSAIGYTSPVSGISAVAWVGLALLVVQALLFLVAFPALRSYKKSGWSILLWASVVNVVYDVVYNLFGGYGYANIGQLIFSLIGVLIGLYLLFQIRPLYTGAVPAKSAPVSTPPAERK